MSHKLVKLQVERRLKILIDGLFKLTLRFPHQLVSADIIHLILMYVNYERCMFMLALKSGWQGEPIEILDIMTEQIYKTRMYCPIPRSGHYQRQLNWKSNDFSTLIVSHHCSLPNSVLSILQNVSYDTGDEVNISKLKDLPDDWNLIFLFNGYTSLRTQFLCVFHPSLYLEDPFTKQRVYQTYRIDLPKHSYHLDNSHQISFVHNKRKEIIYSFCGNKIHSSKDLIQDWEIYHTLKYKDWSSKKSCLCMVDKDRFIAYMPDGDTSLLLLSLNNNIEISLCSMNLIKDYPVSMYHDMFHKIIICDNKSIELYDINKDKWIIINQDSHAHYLDKSPKCLWYYPFDPQTVYTITQPSIIYTTPVPLSSSSKIGSMVYRGGFDKRLVAIDLRSGNIRSKSYGSYFGDIEDLTYLQF